MNVIKFFRKNLDKKGFTLVELLLVIALLAVIGGVFVPRLFGTLDDAKKKADVASAQNLAHSAELLVSTGNVTGLTTAVAMTLDQLQLTDASRPKPQVTPTTNLYFIVVYTKVDSAPDTIEVFYSSKATVDGKLGTALTTMSLQEITL